MHKPTVDSLNGILSKGAMPQRPAGARGTSASPARPGASASTETPLPQPVPARDDLGPLVGRTFGGYEIVSYIGEGPSGAVYRGEDLLGNAMAVKVLHAGLAQRDRTEQLRTELMRLSELAAIGCPQLQSIYDSGYGDEGQFFYVTDELVGCDLETGLDDSGGLAPRKSYEIVRAVLQALDTAHQANVVHGGLRPRNVFIIPADRGTAVKVLDFCAARLGGGGDRGIIAGLPTYLAPEQLDPNSDGQASSKSDLYALGVLMYELFSGSPPVFRGGQQAALSGRRGQVAPPGGPAGNDAQLQRLILSLLENDPNRRPASAAAVLVALDAWAGSAQGLLDPLQPAVVRRRGPTSLSGSIGPDSTTRMSKFDAIALAQETVPGITQGQSEEAVHTSSNERIAAVSDEGDGDEIESEVGGASDRDKTQVAPMKSVTKQQASSGKMQTMQTLQTLENAKPGNKIEGQNLMTQKSTSSSPPAPQNVAEPAKENASESVEASLEDFISQANATFPAADGWDLHTGDVELVEDEATGATIAQVRTTAPVTAQRPVSNTGSMPAVEMPRRITERTEVVSAPLPGPTPPAAPSWTHNPLIVGAIVLGAVVVGAGVMFMAIRTMVPQQPQQVFVQQPAPVVVAPAAAPVVTQLPPAAAPVAVAPVAAAPVAVAPVAATPIAVAPVAAAPVAVAPVVTQLPSAAETPQPVTTAPAHKAPVRKAAAAHKEPAPKKEAAAPAPKKEAAAKPAKESKKESKKSSGGDWVDPFAN